MLLDHLQELLFNALVEFLTLDTEALREQFEIDADVGDLVANFINKIDAIALAFLDHVGKLAGLAAERECEKALVLVRVGRKQSGGQPFVKFEKVHSVAPCLQLKQNSFPRMALARLPDHTFESISS